MYKFENTIGGKLIEEFEAELKACIVVPNSWLPEAYQNNKQNPSLHQIENIWNRKHKNKIQRAEHKAERDRRIELYSSQIAKGELTYEPWVTDAISAGRPNAIDGL